MTPRFRNRLSNDLNVVRKDVAEMAEKFGTLAGAKDLGRFTVGTTVTKVPHTLPFPPDWMIYRPSADARVWETQPPDASFLYLVASAAVTVGIVVF